MTKTIRVMSMNLCCDDAVNVERLNAFPHRAQRVYAMLGEYRPELIGFQEATDRIRESLIETLTPMGYAIVGCGREKNYHGESTCLAYRRDLFEMIDAETCWLSHTPTVPASTYGGDQSGCPRVYTAVTLMHRDMTEPFVFLNTHLDHVGQNARLLGAAQVMQVLANRGRHWILTGDMNATPDAPEIRFFTEQTGDRPVRNATADLGGTFHNYGKIPPERMEQIDYVFTTFDANPADAFVVRDTPVNGVWLSDHCPVCATIALA